MVDNLSIQEFPKPSPLFRCTGTVCHQPVMTNSNNNGEKKTLRKVCNRRNHRLISSFQQGLVRSKATQRTRRNHYISRLEFSGQCRYPAPSLETSLTKCPDPRWIKSC